MESSGTPTRSTRMLSIMRRIVEAEVIFLSLVPKGANRLEAIFKEARGTGAGSFEFTAITKTGKNGELYAIAYAPEFRDSQGDIASADVCKQMAHSFARNGAKLDIRHDGKPITKDRAYVAETFLVQKGDPRFSDLPIDPTGGWGVVLKIVDPELQKKYDSGEWTGVSLGGTARVVETTKEQPEGEWAMDAKELLETLKTSQEAMAKSLTEAVTKAIEAAVPKPAAPPVPVNKDAEPKEPEFTGDPTDVKAVQKHREALRKYHLLKSTNWMDPEAVAKLEAELLKTTPTPAPVVEKSAREIELEKELAEIRKTSNQPAGAGTSTPTGVPAGLSKEDADGWIAAQEQIKVLREREKLARVR